MTLEAYITAEHAKGTIDFAFRASVCDGVVEIYIHPIGRRGMTSAVLVVEGDTVREKQLTPR